MSQAQFAEGLGCSDAVAGLILDGIRPPTTEQLTRLPVLLNVSGDWLLTGAPPMDRQPAPAQQ